MRTYFNVAAELLEPGRVVAGRVVLPVGAVQVALEAQREVELPPPDHGPRQVAPQPRHHGGRRGGLAPAAQELGGRARGTGRRRAARGVAWPDHPPVTAACTHRGGLKEVNGRRGQCAGFRGLVAPARAGRRPGPRRPLPLGDWRRVARGVGRSRQVPRDRQVSRGCSGRVIRQSLASVGLNG